MATTEKQRSAYQAKNGNRKVAKAKTDRRDFEEARNRRRGFITGSTAGAFGTLTGAEYNRYATGTTGTAKTTKKDNPS